MYLKTPYSGSNMSYNFPLFDHRFYNSRWTENLYPKIIFPYALYRIWFVRLDQLFLKFYYILFYHKIWVSSLSNAVLFCRKCFSSFAVWCVFKILVFLSFIQRLWLIGAKNLKKNISFFFLERFSFDRFVQILLL